MVEIMQQGTIADAIAFLLHRLLDDAYARDGFNQMRGKPRSVLRYLGPVALGDMLEQPGRQAQQGHDACQAEEQQRRDPPQQHRRPQASQYRRQQLWRALDQQGFQCIHIPVGARDNAASLGAIEITHTQRLHVGKDPHAQIIEDADRRDPGQVLRQTRKQETDRPGQAQPCRHPVHQRLVDHPTIAVAHHAMVDHLPDKPGAQKHGQHHQRFHRDRQRHEMPDRPQQGQQPVEHAAIQIMLGQQLFEFDIRHRATVSWIITRHG